MPMAFYKSGAVIFAAAAPSSILSDEVYSAVDRYGIGVLFGIAAWLFYNKLEGLEKKRYEKLERLEKERDKDHEDHVASLNEEIKRLNDLLERFRA